MMSFARKLSDARVNAAVKLDKEILSELAPLRLEKARFETRVETDEARAGAHGIDRVEFLIAANPGTPLAPIVKAASGGELSRFLLALKVVLAARASAPTLVFDEIDTGVGGAVADAIGQRLSRMSKGLQVLAVTHSPQVASRADAHLLISKMEEAGDAAGRRMITRVTPNSPARGGGRRLRACCPAPRSHRKPAPRQTGCCRQQVRLMAKDTPVAEMTPLEAADELERLAAEIARHDEAYHRQGCTGDIRCGLRRAAPPQ